MRQPGRFSRPGPGRCVEGVDRIACEDTRQAAASCLAVRHSWPPCSAFPPAQPDTAAPRAARGAAGRPKPGADSGLPAAGISDPGELLVGGPCAPAGLPVMLHSGPPAAVTTALVSSGACRRGVLLRRPSYPPRARLRPPGPAGSWPRKRRNAGAVRSRAPVVEPAGRTARSASAIDRCSVGPGTHQTPTENSSLVPRWRRP